MRNRLLLLGTEALKADLAGTVEDGAAPGSLRGEPDEVDAVGGAREDFEGPIERAAEDSAFRGAVCGVVGLIQK